MRWRCSYCHAELASEGSAPPERCSRCSSEIGFEAVGPAALPMRLFAVLLLLVVMTVAVASVIARTGS